MEDYRIPALENLINKIINPIHKKSEELMLRYLRLHGSVYYFEYAVGSIQSQELGLLQKLSDAFIVGSAVSSYMHMDSCIKLFDFALHGISNHATSAVSEGYENWKTERIRYVRNRVAAHPEEDATKGADKNFYIMSKRQMVSTDGRVVVRQIAVKAPHSSDKIELTPRKDLELLRKYLKEMAEAVQGEFKKL